MEKKDMEIEADRKGKGRNVKNDKTSQERSVTPVRLLRALRALAALRIADLAKPIQAPRGAGRRA